MTDGEKESRADVALKRAQALLMERNLREASAAYQRAERLGANLNDCSAGKWEVAMLRGDMEGAWQESDLIRARGGPDPHRCWDGSSLREKRVMVRCLHGFGDTIQMLRYIPALLALAARVVLEVPPRLFPLITSLSLAQDERLEVITWERQRMQASPVWDVQIEVTELPYLFRTQREDLPISVEYVHLPEEEMSRVREGMGVQRAPRVGLVWTAGEWNQERAIAPGKLRSLLRCPAEFWSLVHGHQLQIAGCAEVMANVKDAEIFGEGILPMAAVIANLDLVITTDTLAAHLSGAIGTPVWVMLLYAADWRWMSDAERSSWYPSMRLFRQPAPGDWEGVVARVDDALQGRLAHA